MKTCKKCGVLKPLDDFHKAKGTADGFHGACKECFKAAIPKRKHITLITPNR